MHQNRRGGLVGGDLAIGDGTGRTVDDDAVPRTQHDTFRNGVGVQAVKALLDLHRAGNRDGTWADDVLPQTSKGRQWARERQRKLGTRRR